MIDDVEFIFMCYCLYLGRKKKSQIFILNIDPVLVCIILNFLGCYSVSYYKDISFQ